MTGMVVLNAAIGSRTAIVACPVCGRISRKMLKSGFSNDGSNDLLLPHTCPVCESVFHTCSSELAAIWSSAFARYSMDSEAYEESVQADYAQNENHTASKAFPAAEAEAIKSLLSIFCQLIDRKQAAPKSSPAPKVPHPVPLPCQSAPKHLDIPTAQLERKVEHWKQELLDTSKRNRMISYKDTKRTTLHILEPGAEELFNHLAFKEKPLTFQRPIDKGADFRTYAFLSLLENLNYPLSVCHGDIKTDGTIAEREKTLANLRSKAKLAQEEQGANILYLAFGFIIWREHNRESSPWLKSPLLMMPVSLEHKSKQAPFSLSRYDDEIQVNPTLDYFFNAEYGIDLPTFDLKDSDSFSEYMSAIEEIVDKHGWKLVKDVSMGLFPFLKISMYHDLANNLPLILRHPVLQAISGEPAALGDFPAAANAFNFDNSNPQDWHEVVDSDSSQEEAILLSKLGVSFVMQGPPGTGKSQTITNIIAEAMADGKKVLFVSEKAAALQVVLKRLTDVGLDDFCLPIHNYKANKKQIIDNIGANLSLQPEYESPSALNDLANLFEDRQYLNEYAEELHKPIPPLNDSLYVVFGKLNRLAAASVVDFKVDAPTRISKERYASLLAHVTAFEHALHNMEGALTANLWYGTTATSSDQAFKAELLAKAGRLKESLAEIHPAVASFNDAYHTAIPDTWSGIKAGLEQIGRSLSLPVFPHEWWNADKRAELLSCAQTEQAECDRYRSELALNRLSFKDKIIDAPLDVWSGTLQHALSAFSQMGFTSSASPYTDAIRNSGVVSDTLNGLKLLIWQYSEANERIGLSGADNLNSVQLAHQVISLLQKCPACMRANWFCADDNAQAADLLEEAVRHADALSKAHASIDACWNSGIYNANVDHIRKDFEGIHEWMPEDSDDPLEQCIIGASGVAKSIIATVESILSSYAKACSLLALKQQSTVQHISMIATIMQIVGDAPAMESGWFDIRKHDDLLAVYHEALGHSEKYASLRAKILEDWEDSALTLDAEAMLARFKTEYVGLFHKMKSAYKSDMKTIRMLSMHVGQQIDEDAVIAFLQTLTEIGKEKAWFTENESKLADCFGASHKSIDTDWKKVKEGIDSANSIIQLFPYANIPDETIRAIQYMTISVQSAGLARQLADELSADKMAMLARDIDALPYMDKLSEASDIEQITLPALLQYVDACETRLQSLKAFACFFVPGKPNRQSVARLFDNLSSIERETGWFESSGANLKQFFGDAYVGAHSDWSEIASGIAQSNSLIALFDGRVPQTLIDSACALHASNIADLPCDRLSASSWRGISNNLATLLPDMDVMHASISSQLIPLLEAYQQEIEALKAVDAAFKEYLVAPMPLEECVQKLSTASEIHRMREIQREKSASLSARFGERYAEFETDWSRLVADLEEIGAFQAEQNDVVSDRFIAMICANQSLRAEAADAHAALKARFDASDASVVYFCSLFTNSMLDSVCLSELSRRYEACLNGFGELNKWLDYAETKDECDRLGLSSFTNAIAASDNGIVDICDAFEKGFYTQWLTLAMNDIPAVASFRRRVHEQKLSEFVELDRKQFSHSISRIREKVISRFPDTNRFSKAGSELSILRREMGKKRCIPLRQLFRSIPKLLLTLKPCLMMSPLSVAYFLDANAYHFDMVIFDEASQIFPQDAIGAIFRADQVIIAGDTKQLPPTNFFSASAGNATQDYDDDSEQEYDDTPYDSILEETANVLPNRTLLWHYRSKHEHLIAFSNQAIYRNELMTFPSSNESEPDTGVEFVYVEDGYYEGGGRNCNINEAKRCVELIKDHFDRHPERSLGVIAFSEKQQQAIANEVERFRECNPKYEAFFAEDKEDEFFIKNLESVQGDERDTIFFSIGYAKTEEQKKNGKPMALRFGPLGLQGGERRLNVAITRAKVNVKLISSILPSDIDRAESDGVKMLRSYIDFAKNGEVALASSQRPRRNDDFVDAVYRYLTNRGYKAKTHIGCSGYKIDIAIEHPDLPNQFIVGIECDGFAYASAKTARDRDRLRGAVLEKMGWHMYRIWSAEWQKNPEIEADRLIAFIDEQLAEASNHIPPRKPLEDLSWVKVGTAVRHGSFGDGVITAIRDKYIFVDFAIGEKIFVFPSCFEKKILVPAPTSTSTASQPAPEDG